MADPIESSKSFALPPDDPQRSLAVATPGDGDGLKHVAVAGDTYTILLSGRDTAGRYTLIDMHVPPGGGPPPHRHDFEEMFSVLDGEIELTFRGTATVARAGTTVNIPANAPHFFKNVSDKPARLLCMCSPAGQEKMFLEVGDLVAGPTTQPPELDAATREARKAKALVLAPKYRSEMVQP